MSTAEQGDSGLGLAAQRATIDAEAARRGWVVAAVHEDVASGSDLANRAGLAEALAAVEHGEATVLVVARLDRLSRSLLDFAGIAKRAELGGWKLVAADAGGLDMTTPVGELTAGITVVAAQYERRLIADRTRAAMAEARARGVHCGRPPTLPADVRARIVALRHEGRTWRQVADTLNADGVPTAQGGRCWWPASARKAALVAS